MRVLIVTNLYPPFFRGGYEIAAFQVAGNLGKQGLVLRVLSGDWQDAGSDPVDSETSTVVRSLVYKDEGPWTRRGLMGRLQGLINSVMNFLQARRAINEFKPDVAYMWNLAGVTPGPLIAARLAHIPVILHLMDYSYLNKIRLLRNGHTIGICTSEYIKQAYLDAGVPADALRVVYHGVELGSAELPPEAKGRKLLYAGRIVEDKGVEDAIEALALLHGRGFSDASLDVVGDGSPEYLARLQQLVQARGLATAVSFVGKLSHEQLLTALPSYLIQLVPSRWPEPLALVLAEAMRGGVLVVATAVGGIPEAIDSSTGALVEPQNPVAIAAAVSRFFTDPDLRLKTRLQAWDKLHARFNLVANCQTIGGVLARAGAKP